MRGGKSSNYWLELAALMPDNSRRHKLGQPRTAKDSADGGGWTLWHLHLRQSFSLSTHLRAAFTAVRGLLLLNSKAPTPSTRPRPRCTWRTGMGRTAPPRSIERRLDALPLPCAPPGTLSRHGRGHHYLYL